MDARWVRAAQVFGANGIGFGASLLATVLLSRGLSMEAYGNFAVISSVLWALALPAGSLGPGTSYALARAANDRPVAASCLWLRTQAGLFPMLLPIFGGSLIALLHHKEGYHSLYFLVALQILFFSWELHSLQVLQMAGRFGDFSLLYAGSRLGKAALFALLLVSHHMTLGWVVTGQLVAQSLALWPLMLARNRPLVAAGVVEPAITHPILRRTAWSLGSALVFWGSTQCNILVVNARFSKVETAVYGLADVLVQSLLMVAQSALSLLQPHLMRWNPEDGFRPILKLFLLLAVGYFALVGAAALLAPPLMTLVLGARWQETAHIFRWMAPGAALYMASTAPVAFLHRLERTHWMVWLEGVGACALIGATLLVPASWGARGAALAWTLSRTAYAVTVLFAASWAMWQTRRARAERA